MPAVPSFESVRALVARFSLRANLVVLLFVVVAILAVDRGRELTRLHGEEIARAQSELIGQARIGAERQADVIANMKALLRLAAALPVAAADAGSACHPTFREIVNGLPWLRSLFVAGPDGRAICTSARDRSAASIVDRSYFQGAMQSGDFVLSDYVLGRSTGKPGMVGAFPRLRNGTVETVVIASIEIDWLSHIAAEVGAAEGADVLLVDSAATVIAAHPRPETWVGRSLADNADFVSILQSPDGVVDSSSLDGQRRTISHVRLRDTNAVLAVMLPISRVIANANRLARYEIGKILLTGIASFLVIWFGCERLLIRPIRKLARGATLLGSGDLDTRIATDGLAPELKRLGDSFNDMALQLRARDSQLRRANERLSELASKDALTGIANRRGFDQRLAAEWNRARRTGEPIGLLAIDVDHFKKFNDCYGHLAGDACLQRVATALDRIARKDGYLAARVGGEEFALLLTGTDLGTAAALAETVRVEIEAMDLAHQRSPEARVTVSVGAAVGRADRGGHMHGLFDLADAALYRAKGAGRNCVVFDQAKVSLAS